MSAPELTTISFHEQNLSAWPPHAAIKASFYMSVARADSDFFKFFVNNNPCGDSAKKPSYERMTWDTVERSPRVWVKLSLERELDVACKSIFYGMVLAHQYDIHIAGWEMWIDGKKVVDKPALFGPLPNKEDMFFFESGVYRMNEQPMRDVMRKIIGNGRVVALGEGLEGVRSLQTVRENITQWLRDSCGFGMVVREDSLRAVAESIVGRQDVLGTRAELIRVHNAQDSVMAGIILGLLKHDGVGKIVLWGHAATVREGVDSLEPELYTRYLGSWLSDAASVGYRAFAFTTTARGKAATSGSVGLKVASDFYDEPTEDCYEYYFARVGLKAFFWPVADAHPAITRNLRFRAMGPGLKRGVYSFRPLSLVGNYDGVFYVESVR